MLCEIYEDGQLPDLRHFRPEQDEEAVRLLFGLLDEYFALPEKARTEAGQAQDRPA